ncbi:Molybdopterin molybdenumtransferase, partial [Frankliniella fusca]
ESLSPSTRHFFGQAARTKSERKSSLPSLCRAAGPVQAGRYGFQFASPTGVRTDSLVVTVPAPRPKPSRLSGRFCRVRISVDLIIFFRRFSDDFTVGGLSLGALELPCTSPVNLKEIFFWTKIPKNAKAIAFGNLTKDRKSQITLKFTGNPLKALRNIYQ